MSDTEKKIGILGGTFNPIHFGHLIMAENACEEFGLDKVIFLPTGHAPHKPFMGEEMSVHRAEMVQLAIRNNERFRYCDYEIRSTSVNYTYKTMEHFQQIFPDARLYFILGADSLFDFELWREPQQICDRAEILVAVRADLIEDKVDTQIAYLSEKYHGVFHRLQSPNFDVSSKSLRSRIANGQTIRYMLPDQVREYILKNHLYQA